jgi:hypothetical protein
MCVSFFMGLSSFEELAQNWVRPRLFALPGRLGLGNPASVDSIMHGGMGKPAHEGPQKQG